MSFYLFHYSLIIRGEKRSLDSGCFQFVFLLFLRLTVAVYQSNTGQWRRLASCWMAGEDTTMEFENNMSWKGCNCKLVSEQQQQQQGQKKHYSQTSLYICYICVSKRENVAFHRQAWSLWSWSGPSARPWDWLLMTLFTWTENSQQPCLIRAATTWALGTAPHCLHGDTVTHWSVLDCICGLFCIITTWNIYILQREREACESRHDAEAIYLSFPPQCVEIGCPLQGNLTFFYSTVVCSLPWRKCFDWGYMRGEERKRGRRGGSAKRRRRRG